jgi:hypothetical protein
MVDDVRQVVSPSPALNKLCNNIVFELFTGSSAGLDSDHTVIFSKLTLITMT